MKKKIIFSILIVLILSLLLLNNCGIEDSLMYFQEPRNLHFESDGFLYFNGANQEEDDGNKLFVGYDVYYYFSDSKNAKKAMVRNPGQSLDHTSPPHSNLVAFSQGVRFPSSNFSIDYLNTIYQYVSFPVTESMIEDVLEKGNNDNVRIGFHNSDLIAFTESNPKQNSSSYIMMDELFPNYSEYNGQVWGSLDANFEGFLDQDYYDAKSISGSAGSGYKQYEIYIYVVAKGFNSTSEDDRNKNYIESLKSNVIKITLKALDSTNNH